jgi:hypothetical protein
VPALLLADGALGYWGAASPDADAATVGHLLHACAAFSPAAVRAAAEGARPRLLSARLRAAAPELVAVAASAGAPGAVAAAKAALLMPPRRAGRGAAAGKGRGK